MKPVILKSSERLAKQARVIIKQKWLSADEMDGIQRSAKISGRSVVGLQIEEESNVRQLAGSQISSTLNLKWNQMEHQGM